MPFDLQSRSRRRLTVRYYANDIAEKRHFPRGALRMNAETPIYQVLSQWMVVPRSMTKTRRMPLFGLDDTLAKFIHHRRGTKKQENP